MNRDCFIQVSFSNNSKETIYFYLLPSQGLRSTPRANGSLCKILNPQKPTEVDVLYGFTASTSDKIYEQDPKGSVKDVHYLSPDGRYRLFSIDYNQDAHLGDSNQAYLEVVEDTETGQSYLLHDIPHFHIWWRWVPDLTLRTDERET